MSKVISSKNTALAYETYGPSDGTPVLMIMGLGGQLTMWPKDIIETLAKSGHRVIIFDNRDIGLSDKISKAPPQNLFKQALLKRFRRPTGAPYDLQDMAKDTLELLDDLNISKAHIIGISMGGMIAQIVASSAPKRILTLTTIMSTTNDPSLPGASLKVQLAMVRRPAAPLGRTGAITKTLEALKAIGTPGEDPWTNDTKTRVETSYDRSYYPIGSLRQMAAIISTGSLRKFTRKIQTPTLIIHGSKDPLVPIAGSYDIHKLVKGSRLEIIAGMGHDLPAQHRPKISQLMAEHFAIASSASASDLEDVA